MGFWETLAVIGGGLVALNGVIDATRGVTFAPVRIYRWLRRAIQAVDDIAAIPARLDTLESITRDHIIVADRKVALLDSIALDLGVLVPLTRDVHHEVKTNGGSSIKDAVARLETGVQGLYTASPAITGPVTVIAAPAPARRRIRTPKEPS